MILRRLYWWLISRRAIWRLRAMYSRPFVARWIDA